jgi:hypothetical protein
MQGSRRRDNVTAGGGAIQGNRRRGNARQQRQGNARQQEVKRCKAAGVRVIQGSRRRGNARQQKARRGKAAGGGAMQSRCV